MSVMKDYAKRNKPQKTDHDLFVDGLGIATVILCGTILGLLLGYGALYTGV